MCETTMTVTINPNELKQKYKETLGLESDAYDEAQRMVIVKRDETVASFSGIEALAERNGYFVFATDVDEITVVAREDCGWKSNNSGVVEV